MAKYINCEALLESIKKNAPYLYHMVAMIIFTIPPADVAQVVHARWIYGITLGHEWRKCSNCLMSQEIFGSFPYCPDCGARMDGEAE